MILKVACATLMLLALPEAAAENWTWGYKNHNAASDMDGGTIEFDRDSVQRNGDKVLIDVRTIFGKPMPMQGGIAVSMHSRDEIDCTASTVRQLTTRIEGADGAVLETKEAPQPPRDIPRASPHGFAQTMVCPLGVNWTTIPNPERMEPGFPAQLAYDASNIERSGATILVWERSRYSEPVTLAGQRISILDTRTLYDCSAMTYRIQQVRTFGDAELGVFMDNEPMKAARPLRPGSLGVYRFHQFCDSNPSG